MSASATALLFDQDAIRQAVDTILSDFTTAGIRNAQRRRLPQQAAQILSDFITAGGKRIRPLLCVTGWQAAGGIGAPHPVLKAAASLEMFHAFALIHDDIIDASDTRRGRPTVHRQVSTEAAILIGDLALVFADDLLHRAGLTPAQLAAALPVANTLRADTIYGQFLDISHAGQPTVNLDQAMAIIQYKTAKYTVEGPLLLGAALAGTPGSDLCTAALSAYGIPVGEAFQLRDDLLGVFGNPRDTGKPALDDLREGKATVLVALALQNATPAQHRTLRRHVGNPHLTHDDADQVRTVLTDTGAQAAVEEMIAQRRQSALTTLDTAELPPHITAELRSMAFNATARGHMSTTSAVSGPAPRRRRVLLASPRGWCAGVDRAVLAVEKALEQYGPPVYVRHEIVHNKYVVQTLQKKGAIFVDRTEEVPEGSTVMFSAHGVAPTVHAEAAERNLATIDATCPLVTKVHKEAVRYAREGYDILLIGHEGHEEVIGTSGEAPEHITVVDGPQDVANFTVRRVQTRVAVADHPVCRRDDGDGPRPQGEVPQPSLTAERRHLLCHTESADRSEEAG